MGSVRQLLTQSPVTVSAPCRVDAGGTWDIKALALPLRKEVPATVNMALTLRTAVTLLPYEDGRVKIFSRGFSRPETFSADRLPFNSTFGLFFAAVSYFGFHGLEVRIDSRSPVKSALGGSSTALVALVGALQETAALGGDRSLSRDEILHLAYHLEDGVGGGNCGIQDQAAAVHGGVHLWEWHFGNAREPLTRTPLLDPKDRDTLSSHILVAYSGKSHVSAHTNHQWVNDFLSGKTRSGWIKANKVVRSFAMAVKAGDWDRAAFCLREEMSIRKEITPEALDDVTEKLVNTAETAGCGARFAGAGAGGSVWALGKKANMNALKKKWTALLAPIKEAQILDAGIDPEGVRRNP